MLALCQKLRDNYNIAAVTNDIFTKEDGEFLVKNKALDPERIVAIETGTLIGAKLRSFQPLSRPQLVSSPAYRTRTSQVAARMRPFARTFRPTCWRSRSSPTSSRRSCC